jgi:hypothetical protein
MRHVIFKNNRICASILILLRRFFELENIRGWDDLNLKIVGYVIKDYYE